VKSINREKRYSFNRGYALHLTKAGEVPMEIERNRIHDLVYASIISINETKRKKDEKLELSEKAILLGAESRWDSLDLVALLVDLETRLSNELGLDVLIKINEETASKEGSPFWDVKSLIDYVCSVVTQSSGMNK